MKEKLENLGVYNMNVLPYIFVLLAAILWGTTGTVQTFIDDGISPISVATMRSLIGGGVLLIIVLSLKKIKFNQWSWKWTILAAFLIGLFQASFFTSVRLTGVAVGTVVTIGSSPIFAGFIEWLMFKRKPDRIWQIATSFAVLGVVMLFLKKGDAVIDAKGISLALLAGMLFAFYTNVSKKLMEKEEALPSVALIFTICSLFLLPFAAQDGFGWIASPINLASILFMAIMTTSVAYLLFLSGLKKIHPSSAVTLSLGEPLTAALLGVFFLKESISFVSWLGIFLILSGILVLTFGPKKAQV